ncbi:MAG: riboflavin synthase [Hirschia sp.]|nr:riboflavin synthase [Hirschia sp.]MBF19898.1 riboflavin synthase [Hirschia sp.]
MFTGLVRDVGHIVGKTTNDDVVRFRVESTFSAEAIEMGASIMHSGVCLTVVDFGGGPGGTWHEVEAIPQTLSCTILGDWEVGYRVNLEPSLRMGDELGGHYVFGHVDCVATIASIKDEGGSRRIRVHIPHDIAKYLAAKGSIAVDGISLTVAATGSDNDQNWFEVAIIPHTWDHTTLRFIQAGSHVNLEVDMLARYVARMLGKEET